MSAYIYCKTRESINIFEDLIKLIKKKDLDIFVIFEHKRNFGELEKIKEEMSEKDLLLISSLTSLGINEADIANELEYFINKKKYLLVANIDSTYKFGISQPMNQAVLKTLLDSLLLSNSKIIELDTNRKSNAGRNKIEFPDSWEELYKKWVEDEISSKQFMEKSGLKKATFYNMIGEYREILKENEDFIKKYKLA